MLLDKIMALLCLVALACASSVPVVMWGQLDDSVSVSAVREYTFKEFDDILHQQQTGETIVVAFAEDVLSTDDLSKYRSSFPALQRISGKMYISSVDSPLEALEQFADNSAIQISAQEALSEGIPIDSRYVTVQLNTVLTESRAEQLSRHDAEIAAITTKLIGRNVVYIYTGRSHVLARTTRQAVEQASAGVHFNSANLMIYYTQLSFDNVNIPIASMSAIRQNDTHIAVRLHSAVAADDVTFDVATDTLNWWSISTLQFRNDVYYVRETTIGALPDFSFHCAPELLFNTISQQGSSKVSKLSPLRWAGLQIEPNFKADAVPRTQFSDSWDCVGFVSAGMLGGFLVVLLMLVIVTIGLTWIMDIRTMDRFDDPKGKAIVVAQSD